MRDPKLARRSSALIALFVVAACSAGDGSGLLSLKVSPDSANPPPTGVKILLTGTGNVRRSYSVKFPPDNGGSLVIEYPGLPAGGNGMDITVQLLDANACAVGETASAVRVVIRGGATTSAEVFLRRSTSPCGDAGIPGARIDGGPVDVSAELPRSSDATGELAPDSGDTGAPVDVPLGNGDVPPGGDGAGGTAGQNGGADTSAGGSGSGGAGGARQNDVAGGDDGGGLMDANWRDVLGADAADVPVDGIAGSAGTGGVTGSGGVGGAGGIVNSGGTVGTGGASTQPVCGNGTIETGETCDPPSSCQILAQACVSDANTVRTPTGAVASCTFACASATRGCVGGDGFCPTGCTHPTDGDCPKEPGEACATASECRLGFCVSTVCCDRACTGACESCNRSTSLGTCALPDYTTDPAHCGNCSTVCKYNVCQGGVCVFTKDGLSTAGASSANRFTGNEYCTRLHIATAGHLAALGANIGTNTTAGILFRLALYSSSSNAPLTLVAQTSELASVSQSAVEGLVTSTSVAAADYWLCLATSATLRVTTESSLTGPTYTGTMTYGPFPSAAPIMTLASPDPLIANLYTVTTP